MAKLQLSCEITRGFEDTEAHMETSSGKGPSRRLSLLAKVPRNRNSVSRAGPTARTYDCLSGSDVNGVVAQKRPELEAELQATLNVIPGYTWYALPSGALVFVNEPTADYLGLPKDRALRFGIDTGAAWNSHIPLLHPDGQLGSCWAFNPSGFLSTGRRSCSRFTGSIRRREPRHLNSIWPPFTH